MEFSMTKSFTLDNKRVTRSPREVKASTFMAAAILLLVFAVLSVGLGVFFAFAEDWSMTQLKRETSPKIRSLWRDAGEELKSNRKYSMTLKLLAGGFFVGSAVSLLMWASRRDGCPAATAARK